MVKECYAHYPKHIIFNGIRFYRDDQFGYYRHCFSKGNPIFLHRYVWEFYNGKIKEGFEIHHKDFDKSNNDISNLEMLCSLDHHKIHGDNPTQRQKEYRAKNRDRFIEKAKVWHKSEAGRKWHSEHARTMPRTVVEKVCQQCSTKYKGHPDSLFCSNACKSKWRRDHHIDDVDVICSLCGKMFRRNKHMLNKNGLNYCSKVCSSKVMYANTHGLPQPTLTKFFLH